MLEKVEKVERERMVAAAAERKGPFEEYIFVPRAISFPTARWTKMWFVLDDEVLSKDFFSLFSFHFFSFSSSSSFS